MQNLNVKSVIGVKFDTKQKKQLFSLRKLPCDCERRGHCMCKEMPVIPVNRVVDEKRIIGKNGGC
jgi:tetrahydromethanopterin S-methyltransferase subunit A